VRVSLERETRPRSGGQAFSCLTARLSSGDFVPVLSAPVFTRLTETWKAGQRAFDARNLSGVGYVYLRADGIHVDIRLEEQKLCLLVMVGVRADGARSSSPWPAGTGGPPNRGLTCCAIAPVAGWAARYWRPVTGHWDSGGAYAIEAQVSRETLTGPEATEGGSAFTDKRAPSLAPSYPRSREWAMLLAATVYRAA
jgi:hypothetical protein